MLFRSFGTYSNRDNKKKNVSSSASTTTWYNKKLYSFVTSSVSSAHKLDINSFIRTAEYMSEYVPRGEMVYIEIHSGNIYHFIPFGNEHIISDGFLEQIQKKGKHGQECENIQEYMKSYNETLLPKKQWKIYNGRIHISSSHETSSSQSTKERINHLYRMIEHTCNEYNVPNISFFVNLTGDPILKSDYTLPYFHNDGSAGRLQIGRAHV